MTKTYEQLREQTQELNELRIVRTGAALMYASKVRDSGKRVESKVGEAQTGFSKAQKEKNIEDKIDALADGLSSLGEALIAQRLMLGNMTGVALSSALFEERSNKEITKLMKGSRRR